MSKKQTKVVHLMQETDNIGTRLNDYENARNYWALNMFNDIGGFVVFTFQNEADARAALLSLEPIHIASDSGNLISTDIIVFGYYQRDDGVWQADISGNELTYEVWAEALECFAKFGGKMKNSHPPETKVKSDKSAGAFSEVVFEREKVKTSALGTLTYRYYNTSDLESAKAFLKQNPVNVNFLYLVVKTPEGKLCRDINGIYSQ